ncbi:winged helix-turn-helix transcriptional regulator [Nitrosopumilus sp. K4]|uniref:ArsR/SmtB family transcription factor n=1 Tax=Nitrosopumilus sp. K4 TaxID=2795383 RepID=UPI001BA6AEDB|nr:winged helix-turn-helix domain-containing protein [Nitrosopumilus sp. K4]QUC64309.1 winged helix-turn-helix transcriptional regulator [Nitrosopumilus sp. K4]
MSSDEPNVSDKIDILSTEDEKLKAVGEILSSDSSRQILKLLFNNSLSANQISQKTELSLPLVIHHLKKMQNAGVIKITNVGKNSKSHDVKFYTIDKVAIVILPSEMQQPAKKSKSLFNSFNRIHRLATLGGVSLATWFSSQLLKPKSPIQSESIQSVPASSTMMESDESMFRSTLPKSEFQEEAAQITMQTGEPSYDILWSALAVLCVIVAGLVIEIIITSRKKKIHTNNG